MNAGEGDKDGCDADEKNVAGRPADERGDHCGFSPWPKV
jgi:hypothetical protein